MAPFANLSGLKRLPFIAVVLSLLLMAASCETANPLQDPPVKEPQTRVFYDEFDQVWRAIQLAVRKYPVRLNNIESGMLETDYVKADKIFNDPSEGGPPKSGIRYKINIRAVKGKIDDKSAVKVIVTKIEEVQPDFFTGFKQIPSNGLEENAIMYRIARYLEMDKRLNQSGKD